MGKKNKQKKQPAQKAKGANELKGEITRVVRGHGFLREINKSGSGTEYFLAGRDLMGAIPGDTVLFRKKKGVSVEGGLTEAAVVRVLERSAGVLTGTVVENGEKLSLSPDSFGSRFPLEIRSRGKDFKAGDKVKFSIKSRGDRHSDHIADIVSVYGDSAKAKVCVLAYLEEKNIPVAFPEAVIEAAENAADSGISPDEIAKRLDLRGSPIFTIDGADTKDIDDAVDIERVEGGGYKLGVHIADVSRYVTAGSPLDKEAFRRGTSVYIADLVVPMLPKELSNGICSLNPNEDRLAFSCLMDIGADGSLKSFKFKKTVIKSRVQGVYSEVNAILGGAEVPDKYKQVADRFPIMAELANILKKNRESRGAPALEAAESKIVCGADGECEDVKRRVSGVSEGIIEEFMLMANNAAAKLAMEKALPFVYRIHEPPTEEKITRLSETLAALGVKAPVLSATARSLSDALEAARKTDRFDVINMAVLRSMMKAKYSAEPLGHFGLVMKEYAHFTSPIRRYPDLSIHRILSDYVAGKDVKKYDKFAHESSLNSSITELRAISAERDCNCFYFAEYMSAHIGEEFGGVISGVTDNSLFVMLENTVEGRVSLPYGEFKLDGDVATANAATGERYTLGDKIRVKCVGARVPAGNVDFEIIAPTKGSRTDR